MLLLLLQLDSLARDPLMMSVDCCILLLRYTQVSTYLRSSHDLIFHACCTLRRWTPIRVRPAPSARFGHSACVFHEGRYLVMFGGCVDLTTSFLSLTRTYGYGTAELWLLDLASFR